MSDDEEGQVKPVKPPNIKDLDDYKRLATERHRRRQARQGQSEQFRVAALIADQATGTREWDRFLELLQAEVESSIALRERAQALLTDPAILDHLSLLEAKVDVVRLSERIMTLQYVIGLPKQLRAGLEPPTIDELDPPGR